MVQRKRPHLPNHRAIHTGYLLEIELACKQLDAGLGAGCDAGLDAEF